MSISAWNANSLLKPEPGARSDLGELAHSAGKFALGALVLIISFCAWWRGESDLLVGVYIQAVFAALLLMWVCGVGITVERAPCYWGARKQSRKFESEAAGPLRDRSLARVVEIAKHHSRSPSARVAAAGLESFLSGTQFLPGAEAVETAKQAMRRAANAVHLENQRGLWLLATFAATAPLVGFLGTTLGVVYSFRGYVGARWWLIVRTSGDLAEALVPTVLALFVAVPMLWCHRYLSSESEAFDVETKNQSLGLVNYLITYLGGRT